MSKKKQKKNYNKNYRKDYQKARNTFSDRPALRLGYMKDGAIEHLISTCPYGFTECDLVKLSGKEIEVQDIPLPIPGNQFLVAVNDQSALQAVSETLTALKYQYSLRLFHSPATKTLYFATDAAVETVTTLFEYILRKHGIGVGCCVSFE